MSPRRAPAACGHPGCPHLTPGRYCPDHQREADARYRQERGTSTQRGYGRQWAIASRAFRKANPVCMACHEAPSQCTDHVIPVQGPTDPRFWDRQNWAALCTPCHSRKTVVEDRRGLMQNPPVVRTQVPTPPQFRWIL